MKISFPVESGLRVPALPLLAVAASAVLSACSNGYGSAINGDRALSPEEQRLQATETKVADLTRRMNGLEASRANQSLGDDVRNLRGQVEQLRYDFDSAQKRSQDQDAALDARLRVLEGGAAAQTGGVPATGSAGGLYTPPSAPIGAPANGGSAYPPPSAPVGPAPAAAAAAPQSAAADEEALYLKGFDSIKAGKYDDAIRSFRGMLDKYPQGNYSDNAWYWMGESYNIKRDYPNALQSYRSLLEKFPASPKVPVALLKGGMGLQEQKKTDQARAAYQRVLKDYPNAQAATQARTRLDQLK